MSFPLQEVTAVTKCPSVLGGRARHYPRTVADRPVTMPYVDTGLHGLPRTVILSLCGKTYLVPPADGDDQTSTSVCVDCAVRRAAAAAEAQTHVDSVSREELSAVMTA